MQSKATTVEQYLAELPEDRRAALVAVREVILRNLDKDYEEGMQYGMIGYYVPHRVYPAGYHCDPRKPLPFAALASQKNYMSVYLIPIYGEGEDERWFRQAWAATGKKLDMGKCCIRFKKVEDLALDVIGEAIRRAPVQRHIAFYEAVLGKSFGGGKKAGGAKPNARAKKTTTAAGARKTSRTGKSTRSAAARAETAPRATKKAVKRAAKKSSRQSAR